MIPVSAPDLRGNEEAYVTQAIRSSWISSTGAFVQRFEREFAERAGARHAISVSNGTVALHAALLALDIGVGDEVILPSLTYVAPANAVLYVGATPVFAEVDPSTWCVDPVSVAELVTERTKAIIAVHLYGHPADMDALWAIAEPRGIAIVEDAAEAHGARYRSRIAGSLGTIATFSFYGNKIVTSGEGGAITTDDDDLAARVRLFRGQGMDPERRYWFPIVGHNFRLTNVACAILCAQLERFDEMVAARRAVFARYAERLSAVAGVGLQPVAAWAEQAPWLFSVTINPDSFGCSRDELAERMAGAGVDTRPLFIPVHRLPPYNDALTPLSGLPITDTLADSGLSLPTSSVMTAEDIDRVVEVLCSAQST
jgi:perosamine synthetase